MSEVKRFRFVDINGYPAIMICDSVKAERFVEEQDFDRVTAERDVALRQVETITADRDAEKQMKAKARIQRDVQTAKATDLQERLTAANERADVLEGLLREVAGEARHPDYDWSLETSKAVDAALKPALGE